MTPVSLCPESSRGLLRSRAARSSIGRRGFTLVEVLATMALLAIALPVIMEGISLATATGSFARHRTEAAALAESKLNELVATGAWESSGTMAGDFPGLSIDGSAAPVYHWTATTQDAAQTGLQQLDVRVSWTGRRGQPDEMVLSTFVYSGSNASSGSSGSSNSSTGSASGTGGGTK